jgi:hypothetical protein
MRGGSVCRVHVSRRARSLIVTVRRHHHACLIRVCGNLSVVGLTDKFRGELYKLVNTKKVNVDARGI